MGNTGFRFGAFELDTGTGELFKHGVRIKLQIKPLQILQTLLARPGELVTREELRSNLWPAGTFVDFESRLNTATNRLRAALGDSAESPRYIETLPRLGYRFICPVTSIPGEAPQPRTAPKLAPAADGTSTPAAKPYRPLSPVASAIAIVLAFAYIHVNATAPHLQPNFRQLTFRAGAVGSARFVPGSNNAIYTAMGEGEPPRTSLVPLNGDSAHTLNFATGVLASVSARGELAFITRTPSKNEVATLWRVPGGTSQNKGAAQTIAADAPAADWLPDGSSVALVRRREAESRLEFPAGHLVYTSRGWIDSLRVSPAGDRAAFFEHPVRDDDGGYLRMVDKQGRATTLTHQWSSAAGLAWAPSGKAIWFTASEAGFARAVYAVSTTGRLRKLSNSPFSLHLFDISRDGRALIALDDMRVSMTAQLTGDTTARDVSNLDSSHVDDIARDGRLILFTEASSAVGEHYAAYTLDRKSHLAVRFAQGRGLALSPDGKSALTIDPEDRSALTLTSLATGVSRRILGGGFEYQWAKFLPDGNSLLVGGAYPLEPLTICKQFLEGGTPVALANALYLDHVEISADGSKFAGSLGNQLRVFDLGSGQTRPLLAGERVVPVAWSADGNDIYVATLGDKPDRILKVNLRSGKRETWKTIAGSGTRLTSVVAAPETGAFAYSAEFSLSRLYVVDGWS
jgi:DNA-binding winged helix-turn-helix (wHTH) protein/WD40 repeat protein